MTREEVINKLEKAKALNLPVMTYAKYKEYFGDIPKFEETDENIKIMDDYFKKFLDPKNEFIKNGCWLCEKENTYYSWGIPHGIAHSECCGLDYVIYHYLKDIFGDNTFSQRLERALQYHPNTFEIND